MYQRMDTHLRFTPKREVEHAKAILHLIADVDKTNTGQKETVIS